MPTAAEVASNDEDQFSQNMHALSVVIIITMYLKNRVGDSHLFCISDTSNSLPLSSISMLEDFPANIFKMQGL